MDSNQMRKHILNFSFDNCLHGNQGFSRLLLQLFGFMGNGKSSFINSCKFVLDNGDYKIHAPVARPEEDSKTLKRDVYALTNNVTLVDNRGCAKLDANEAGEIYAQLGNIQPLDQEVTWDSDYRRLLRQLIHAGREDRSGDFIAPVFVYSAQKRIYGEYNEIKELLKKAKDITKLVPAVVITHETHQNLPNVQSLFRSMGVQLIFTVENYTQEDHLKIRMKHEKILRCLYEIIKDVEFRMEEIRNPRQEMEERAEILHTFLIERETDRVREEIERRESERRERERQEARDRERRAREAH